MNDFQKQLYNTSLTAAIKQAQSSLKPIKLQLDVINNLYKIPPIVSEEIIKNIQELSSTTELITQAFNKTPLFNNQIKQIQQHLNDILKDSLPIKTLTAELKNLQNALSIAMPYLPEDVVKEVQEEFEEQIQENNELLNTSELDKNILEKILIRKNIIFSLSILISIVDYIYNKNLSIFILNTILSVYTLITEPKSKD